MQSSIHAQYRAGTRLRHSAYDSQKYSACNMYGCVISRHLLASIFTYHEPYQLWSGDPSGICQHVVIMLAFAIELLLPR